ncbi:MAG: hypothetical protein HYX93_06480 [Chloroflexi bacterium]|nr:hypothetical protein [Chloroflexota bacterium]
MGIAAWSIAEWGLAVGVLALILAGVGIMLAPLIEAKRHPSIKALSPWFEPATIGKGYKRWHLAFINNPNKGILAWIGRESAMGVEATIEFFYDGQRQQGDTIRGIWSEQPRPLRDDLIIQARMGNLIPGRQWSIPTVFKFKGSLEAHQWDERNYGEDGGVNVVSNRNLPEGDYAVRAVLHISGRVLVFWYRLNNRTDELTAFRMCGPFKRNPIKSYVSPRIPSL